MQKTVKTLTQTPASLLFLTASILVLLYKYAGNAFGVEVILKQGLGPIATGLMAAALACMKRHTFMTPVADKAFDIRFLIIECLRYALLGVTMLALCILIFAPKFHMLSIETVARVSALTVIIGLMVAFALGMKRTMLLRKYAQASPKS